MAGCAPTTTGPTHHTVIDLTSPADSEDVQQRR
jgi:hypothetical protein